MFRYLLSFFLFSGGGHIDQNGIFDYNVKKKKKKKKNDNTYAGTLPSQAKGTCTKSREVDLVPLACEDVRKYAAL